MHEFSATAVRGDRTWTVVVRGELDDYTAPRLRECFGEALEAGAKRVVVDLSKMSFIDSTGIGALVGGLKRFRSVGGDLELDSPSRSAFRVLELTGLTRVFHIRGRAPADAVLARALEAADRLTDSETDAAVDELLAASGRDRAVLNQARARCLGSLQARRANPRGSRALDLLDRCLEELES